MSNILLCIDDSVTMQTVAEITFRGTDWEYVGARNAEEARAAGGKSPTMILVDAVMPDGSGYDLAQELKAANAGATVVMMCGNSEAYDEGKGAAAGCDGHIVKPWQTDKVVDKLKEMAAAGPSAATAAPAAAAPAAPMPAAPKAADSGPPRSATLMGMPALEMPPSKPLPAGVASIKPVMKAAAIKPAIPAVKTPPPPAPVAVKPPVPTPAPPVAVKPAAGREPMIKAQPGKPIRLVLASQAEAMAKSSAENGGMNSDQASALGEMSRDMLERIIWDVVPELAESIIRENLDTLTAKAR